MVTVNDILNDRHAATYAPALEHRWQARDALLTILNDPANERCLTLAEELGRPALAGVVRRIENDPAIAAVLDEDAAGHRFRQAVGVLVRLRMNELGWNTTGTKGTLPNAAKFTKAERYTASSSAPL